MKGKKISRRQFLRSGAVIVGSGTVALGFLGCRSLTSATFEISPDALTFNRYSDLVPDPNGLLDLPSGFTYRILSQTGERMDDGLLVPGCHDGMAAFPGPNGKTILVRNHEMEIDPVGTGPLNSGAKEIGKIGRGKLYDPGKGTKPPLGGTTTLIYDTRTGALEKHYMSLAGTLRNCAGGPTPWNSWLSCEETVQRAEETFEKDHGYNFEVPASAGGLVTPVPLVAMGRFNHEAVAVDARTGIVYQTEDRNDGLIYRFIPNHPGELTAGGRLQALRIRDMKSAETRNWKSWIDTIFRWTYDPIPVGQPMDVEWVDIENVESPQDDLRYQGREEKGAARFARGEGMWYGGDAIYFVCTNGGLHRVGQVWRYRPSPFEGTSAEDKRPGQLELFIEPNNGNLLENGDNVTISPCGDLILCEDGSQSQFLVGVTPDGKLYKFAKNVLNTSELAGATFSPDGSTLFVNIQRPGMTLAITGPWQSLATAFKPANQRNAELTRPDRRIG